MGKASQRKKARKQEQANADEKVTSAVAKKQKGKNPKKEVKKEAKGVKAKGKKVTKLEISAKVPDKNKTPATPKTPEKTTHIAALKGHIDERINNFKEGLDPEKTKILKKELKIITKGGAYFTVGIIAVVALVLSIELHSNNRVFPGTKAGSTNLSYLTYSDARTELVTEIQNYLKKPLVFKYKGETKEISAEDLNLRINIDQTMAQMPIIEFEKTNPAQLLVSLFSSQNVIPNYIIDGDKTIKSLEQKFNLTDKRAKNAKLVFVEEEFQVQPETSGTIINRPKLIKDLRNNLDNISSQPIEIELMEEQPRITAQELSENKDNLIALLDKPIALIHEDEALDIKLLDHLDAVNFKENSILEIKGTGIKLPIVMEDGQVTLKEDTPVKFASNVQIGVNTEGIAGYLQENLIQEIEVSTSPANIYTNEEEKVIIEGKGEDGKSVSKGKLVTAIELAVNNNISQIPVPVHVEHAPVTISDDLQEKGVRNLLATGHSAYYGSPANRMFNIKYGTDKYNGVLIAPGEEFSFNDFLGPVDYTSGFKSEKVIKKDKLEYEIGGGICQVSTTMYRAVLQAGLQITERKPHSWKVSYYAQSMGDGMDATIYPGVTDLKFINDTPGHILIQAYTESAEAYFKIYGTNDGRIVAMDGPYGGGLTYRWNRTIEKDGESNTEEIWSRYRPIPPPDAVEKPKPIAQTGAGSSDGQVNFSF